MRIVLDKQVCKTLDKLDDKTYNRVKEGLNGLLEVPPVGDIKPMRGTTGVFRLRIGKYRVIYEPIGTDVYIHKLSSRGDAYK